MTVKLELIGNKQDDIGVESKEMQSERLGQVRVAWIELQVNKYMREIEQVLYL